MEKEEEEERREAAIAAAPCLQPNFKPSRSVTKAQLSKFQELHKRRLQIKERSKTKKKSNGKFGRTSRSVGKDIIAEYAVQSSSETVSNAIISESSNVKDVSAQQVEFAPEMTSKKRLKLHWGLDTRERWERKSNM